jgi:methylase of polypeptide subunit release factors
MHESQSIRRAAWYLARMCSPRAPLDCTVLNRRFILQRGVFSPAISRSTEFFAKHLVQRCKEKSVIEIGCGCGAIAVLCALHGATKVVTSDINKIAIRCARENVNRHGVNDIVTVVESDFADILGKFDIVFFALPYVSISDVAPMVERFGSLAYSMFDPNSCHQKSFFRYAPEHTKPNGEILAGFGAAGDVRRFEQNLKACDLIGQELVRAREGRSDNRLYLLNPTRGKRSSG